MDRVALVGQLFMGYQAGDMGQVAGLMAPDVRLEPLSTDLEPGPVYEGPAGLAAWARELAESPDEFQPAVESIEPVGETVLAVGSVTVATQAGPWERVAAAWLFEFDESSRVRRMRAFLDVAEARAAAAAPD
jgi:ketosteroid isomerase-like protein